VQSDARGSKIQAVASVGPLGWNSVDAVSTSTSVHRIRFDKSSNGGDGVPGVVCSSRVGPTSGEGKKQGEESRSGVEGLLPWRSQVRGKGWHPLH